MQSFTASHSLIRICNAAMSPRKIAKLKIAGEGERVELAAV